MGEISAPRPVRRRGDARPKPPLAAALLAAQVAVLGAVALTSIGASGRAVARGAEAARWGARVEAALAVSAAAEAVGSAGDDSGWAIEDARRSAALTRLRGRIHEARAEIQTEPTDPAARAFDLSLGEVALAADRRSTRAAAPSRASSPTAAQTGAAPIGLRHAAAALVARASEAQRTAVEGASAAARTAETSAGAIAGLAALLAAELAFALAARAIRRRRERAARADERADRARFAAELGHAVRTPMNAILGLTEVLLDGRLGREQREALETVRESADGLLATLAQLLDHMKARAGTLEIEAMPFDPRAALYDVVRERAPAARRDGVELAFQVTADVPAALLGDRRRLQQVVRTMIDDALASGERDAVTLRARIAPQAAADEASVTLEIEVGGAEPRSAGDGPGAHQRSARAPSGAGARMPLALRLAGEIASRMGGRLTCPGRASVATLARLELELPVDRRAAATGAAPPVELAALPVLLVDDNPTCRRILKAILQGLRTRPLAAASAVEALAALRQACRDGQPFAAALVDLEMPGLDGIDLARQIRLDPALADLPIVAVTSSAEPRRAAEGPELAIAATLTKPLRQADVASALCAAIAQCRDAPHRPPDVAAPGPAPRPRTLRVLVADDNRVDRTLAARLLEKRGHAVLAVEGGAPAVRACETEPFDVVLMDVEMPGVDGVAATAAIRARERVAGGHVPIIALTAGDNQARALEAGMDAHVTKPVHPNDLADAIARVLPPEAQSAAAAPNAASPLDEEAALDLAGGDRALLVDLAKMCLDDGPPAVEQLHAALDSEDARTVQRVAHRLKGSLLVLAAERASRAAHQLEILAAAGGLDNARAALTELERELERLRPALLDLVDAPAAKRSPAPDER